MRLFSGISGFFKADIQVRFSAFFLNLNQIRLQCKCLRNIVLILRNCFFHSQRLFNIKVHILTVLVTYHTVCFS